MPLFELFLAGLELLVGRRDQRLDLIVRRVGRLRPGADGNEKEERQNEAQLPLNSNHLGRSATASALSCVRIVSRPHSGAPCSSRGQGWGPRTMAEAS